MRRQAILRIGRVGRDWRVWGAWIALFGLDAAAQIFLKIGAVDASGGALAWAPVGRLMLSSGFFLSIACDVLAFLVWLRILERHDLSVAVPATAGCYFVTVAASYLILGETVTPLQFLGLAVMGAGLALVARD